MIGVLYLFLAVLVHEVGHFAAARYHGVRPKQVCIFFNPHFSLIEIHHAGTTWSIGWLPLGGYTDIPGWCYLPQQCQFDIAIAGITFNTIAAMLCMIFQLPAQLALVNTMLAVISLLPWAPYDGAHLFKRRDKG